MKTNQGDDKMTFTWDKLLCDKTLQEKEKTPSSWVDYPLDPLEQDYREIVSSVSFRHLQDKAQVYQLSKGDFVRTRLTHSLESSTIAKQLGIMMIYNSKWNSCDAFKDMSVEHARTVPTVLACAGLLHDMGNPPFGHEGEYAISSYFRRSFEKGDFAFFGKPIREVFSGQMRTDLENFEGNAQILRMLAKCRFPSEEQEANVSYATLSSLIKYPAISTEAELRSPDRRIHKYGCFLSEEEIYKDIRESTGLIIENQPHARNPLAVILEAADDIAYITSDIEDAVSKGTISIEQLVRYMKKRLADSDIADTEEEQMRRLTTEGIIHNLETRIENSDSDTGKTIEFHKWTNFLRNWLMYVTAGSFVKNQKAIMNGEYTGELLEDCPHKYTVRILKAEMYNNVYPALSDIHLAAHNILTDLLDRFINAVIYFDTIKGITPVMKYYIDAIPERFKTAYFNEKKSDEVYNLYLRFRMVIDFIVSMSDGYALEYYKKINAMSY